MKSARTLGVFVAVATLVIAASRPSWSAEVTRPILKTYFETGDVPTQQQFANLIDSFINYNDDGLSITGIITSDSSGSRVATNVPIREFVTLIALFTVPDTGEGLPPMEPDFAGRFGFLGLRLSDGVDTYLGYFQLSMDDPLVVDPPGIHVDYFVFNNTPGEGITIASVPEPASLSLLALGGAILVMRRRARPSR